MIVQQSSLDSPSQWIGHGTTGFGAFTGEMIGGGEGGKTAGNTGGNIGLITGAIGETGFLPGISDTVIGGSLTDGDKV